MPRPRRHDPTIPEHIDQAAIPRGLYWDRSGNGRWYVRARDGEGRITCTTVAGRNARLSDLHTIAEDSAHRDRGTLDEVMRLFAESAAYKALAKATQRSYDASRERISEYPTRQGPFGRLQVARITAPVVQRLIDRIAEQHPTTALHTLQYLRRVLRWGVNRGHAPHNPAHGIEPPTLTPRRRLPSEQAHAALLAHARERGQLLAHTMGSVAPYLWICMELAYLCHLRGIELLDLRESQAAEGWLLADRRKGSNSTRFRWSPRLRAAWDAAIAQRDAAWTRKRRPIPLRAEDRPVIVSQTGSMLTRSSLHTAWQRLIHSAIDAGVITAEERYGLHDLKRKGITDREGTRAEKRSASGHRSDQMLEVYDMSVPLVDPAKAG